MSLRKLIKWNTLILTPLIAACGPSLGEHKFRTAEIVDAKVIEKIDPHLGYSFDAPFLVRVEFSSATNLATASEGSGGLYVDADYCPFRDPYHIGVIGPFYDDKSRNLPAEEYTYESADGRTITTTRSEDRQPKINEGTGEYTYTAYLIPFQKQVHKNRDDTPYDVRIDKRDICLRLDSPGYYLTPSQSNLFRIPRSTIDRLLSELG